LYDSENQIINDIPSYLTIIKSNDTCTLTLNISDKNYSDVISETYYLSAIVTSKTVTDYSKQQYKSIAIDNSFFSSINIAIDNQSGDKANLTTTNNKVSFTATTLGNGTFTPKFKITNDLGQEITNNQ